MFFGWTGLQSLSLLPPAKDSSFAQGSLIFGGGYKKIPLESGIFCFYYMAGFF